MTDQPADKRPALYITRNGMLEPLGQSQVLAYLRGLSREFQFTLISFEKAADLADHAAMERVRADCVAHGIRWLPQRFHSRPKGIAPAWSMVVFLFLCLREVRLGNAALLHARSYIPAAVALIVNRLTGTPFIFDMRALWPEELITSGRLKRGSMTHRAIVWAERTCLKRAAAVISLTEAAVEHLKKEYPEALKTQRIVVIPTCADLDRFVPAIECHRGPRVYGCLGTVLSGWFRLDWLSAFFRAAAARDPDGRFEVISRDDPDRIRRAIGGSDQFQARLSVYSLPPHKVHEAVQRHSVSVMFYAGGEVSELGRSPTRMGEVLGCGRPVVVNEGIGDVANNVRRHNVGVILKGTTQEYLDLALDELETLMRDSELNSRCRNAAESLFSLSSGQLAFDRTYRRILTQGSRKPFNLKANAE